MTSRTECWIAEIISFTQDLWSNILNAGLNTTRRYPSRKEEDLQM